MAGRRIDDDAILHHPQGRRLLTARQLSTDRNLAYAWRAHAD
jgi:hypothetical protein